jgi:uncharacterized protein (TIGR02391 family)
MPRQRLDPNLLEKMAGKSSKSTKYLREQISRRASRQSITSAAAQLIWAQEIGIGIANALNRAPAEVRQEVRDAAAAAASVPARVRERSNRQVATPTKRKSQPITASTIKALLRDEQLRARCQGILRGRKHFDQAIREATTLLDDRLKKKTGITNMNPENLVGKVLNPDPSKAIIEVSADKAEQEGFHSICKGIMLAFRNKAHHSLSDKVTREDALKLCGFVDTILGVVGQATLHLDRV